MRRPVILSPERHDDLGLAPFPFPSRPASPPQDLGKEGRAVEQQPSRPPSKGQHFLSRPAPPPRALVEEGHVVERRPSSLPSERRRALSP